MVRCIFILVTTPGDKAGGHDSDKDKETHIEQWQTVWDIWGITHREQGFHRATQVDQQGQVVPDMSGQQHLQFH